MAPPPSRGRTRHDEDDDNDDFDDRRPLLEVDPAPIAAASSANASAAGSYAGSLLEQVAEGIRVRERAVLKREIVRYVGFAVAILSW
jgi:hypothetical protein